MIKLQIELNIIYFCFNGIIKRQNCGDISRKISEYIENIKAKKLSIHITRERNTIQIFCGDRIDIIAITMRKYGKKQNKNAIKTLKNRN